MKKQKVLVCPRCGGKMNAEQYAISRRDDKTHICSKCGYEEALFDLKVQSGEISHLDQRMEKVWLLHPYTELKK